MSSSFERTGDLRPPPVIPQGTSYLDPNRMAPSLLSQRVMRFFHARSAFFASLAPLLAGMSLAAVSWAPKAHACSPPPPPYVMLEGTIPADGATDVVTNGVIVVSATGTSDGTNTADAWLTSQTLSTQLTAVVKAEGSDAPVQGEIVSWYQKGALWRSTSPLSPSTTYEVTLTVNNNEPAPEGANGPTTLKRSFKTGTASLSPLTLTAEPKYAVETKQIDVCTPDGIGPCGNCAQYEQKSARVMEITIPEIEGGLAEAGYAAAAWMTNGEGLPANTVTLNAFAFVTQKAATALRIVFPEKDTPYGACVHVEISDASGGEVKTEPHCFSAAEVWGADEPGTGGGAGSGGSAGSAGDAGASGEAGSGSGAGSSGSAGSGGADAAEDDEGTVDGIRGGSCSTSGGPVRASGALALGLAALLGLRRRRTAA